MRKWLTLSLGILSGMLIIGGLTLAFYGHDVLTQPHPGCTLTHGVIRCIAPIHPTLPSVHVWQHPYLGIGLILAGIGLCFGIGASFAHRFPARQMQMLALH